jgi:hypothetical protein
MLPATRRSRRWITLVVPLLGLIILLQQLTSARWQSGLATTTETQHEANFACPPAPGMEHVLIVMKTGVTEAPEKVPVHARTTFRCVPNYIVFSDFEEVVEGVQVHNVLRSVDKEVKEQIQDFDLYNRLERSGRKGLIASDATEDSNGAFGMPNNPGWKLDKWKFLPMIDEALKAKPDARWYVFMEADTHLVLPNLAAWLDRLNPDEPLYLGTETQIGDVLFGHGGSGVIVSHTAMRMASEHRAKRVAEYDQYTDEEWAGDMVLGKVLFDAGVDLTFTWPLLQNARLGEVEALTNSFYRQPWCWPVVGFHHLTPSDVEDMWRFDQDWFVKVRSLADQHVSIFADVVHREATSFFCIRMSSGSESSPNSAQTLSMTGTTSPRTSSRERSTPSKTARTNATRMVCVDNGPSERWKTRTSPGNQRMNVARMSRRGSESKRRASSPDG